MNSRVFHVKTVLMLTLLVLTTLNFSVLAAGKMSKGPVRFAIIGDRTGAHEPEVYGDIIREIELLKPDFVMTVGDMIEGYSKDQSQISSQWDEYKTLIEPLTCPIYHTPGNHDISPNAPAEMMPLFEENIGEPNYSFDYRKIHITVFDNSIWNASTELPQEKLAWLEADLKKAKKAAYRIVFMHKPFWFNEVSYGKPDLLHDLFKMYNVDAVFTGHFHTYFSGEYDGIKYTSIGSSGGGSQPGITGLHYHYAWVTIDDRGLSVTLLKKDSALPWDDVTADNIHMINNIAQNGMIFENPVPVAWGGRISAAQAVLKIANLSETVISDTLEWDIPEGWRVDPEWQIIDIPVGEERSFNFTISNGLSLYPAPIAVIDLPVEEGKTFEAKRLLTMCRQAFCYPANPSPVIDGTLDERCWLRPINKLYAPDISEDKTEGAEFYFAYDKTHLYLGAKCIETDQGSMKVFARAQDDAVYQDDCVGYFIQPDRNTDVVYQLYFNPDGAVFDQKIWKDENKQIQSDPEWNGEYSIKTAKDDGSWTIEIAVPLETLGTIPMSGSEFGLNFRRKQQRLNTSADWQLPISYDASTYGRLVFK